MYTRKLNHPYISGVPMNRRENAILECTACSHRHHTQIWIFIDYGQDSKLDDKIFTDEINFYTCPRCEHAGFAMYPVTVLYREADSLAVVIPTYNVGF